MSIDRTSIRSLTTYGGDEHALGTHTSKRGLTAVWWLAGYLRPYRVRFAVMFMLTIISSTVKIGGLLFIKPFCDLILGNFDVEAYARVPLLDSGLGHELLLTFAELLGGNPHAALMLLIGLVLGTMALHAMTGLGAAYFQHQLGARVGMDVQRDVLDRVLDQPVAFYAERGKGEITTVIGHDSFALYRTFYVFFDRIVRGVVEAGGALALALALDWRLTLLSGSVVLPVVFVIQRFSTMMRRRERIGYHFGAVMSTILQELVASPQVVKAFQMESYFRDRLEWVRQKHFRRHMSLIKVRAWMTPLVEAIIGIVLGLFIYYNGLALMSGRLDVSYFVLLYACLGAMLTPLRKGAKGYGELVLNMQSVYRVLDLMERAPSVRDREDAVPMPSVQGRVEFRDVAFSYKPGVPVLRDVSFTIEAGERVALVGMSGAGKSTLAALLLRFHNVEAGDILIDGVNIADVRQDDLRKHLGLVTQETVMFSDTVRVNITCGRPGTDAQVEAAARAALAHDFIRALPKGYDTNLGDMGTNLSGGQRQRIAVARCLFRDTQILVLDEATSSLDAVTEGEMQREIDLLTAGRTTIIIAHRFSTILHADRVIFLDGGRVQAIGTHDELFAGNALYRELFERQTLTAQGVVPSSAGVPTA